MPLHAKFLADRPTLSEEFWRTLLYGALRQIGGFWLSFLVSDCTCKRSAVVVTMVFL